jgi:hypothetical protein
VLILNRIQFDGIRTSLQILCQGKRSWSPGSRLCLALLAYRNCFIPSELCESPSFAMEKNALPSFVYCVRPRKPLINQFIKSPVVIEKSRTVILVECFQGVAQRGKCGLFSALPPHIEFTVPIGWSYYRQSGTRLGFIGRGNKVMRIFYGAVIATLLLTACSKAPPAHGPDLLRPATIKDIMDAMVDPSGDFVFQSIQEIADEHGISEKAPKTDAEWEDVRHRLVVLVEAPNLLTMEGRKAARHEDRSRNPRVENEPEQVQKLLDDDRPSFIRRARRLQDAAALGLKAVDAKDKDALFQAIDGIDKACENCHLHYWYPNDKRAQEAAKKDGITE